MKKTIGLVFCIVMVLASMTMAAPAPRLTKINISAFTAQNYNYKWKPAPDSYPKSMSAYSFSGSDLHMDVVYTGYPDWNFTYIKINGTQLTHSEIVDQQLYITNRGVIVGFEVIYKIPPAYLGGSNTITINASGANGGSASNIATNIRFAK